MNIRRAVLAIAVLAGLIGSSPAYAVDGIGQPQITPIGSPVTLDTTTRLDIDPATPLRLEWTWFTRPATSVATFSTTTALRPIVTPDVAGRYVAKLSLFAASSPAGAAALHSVTVEFGTVNLKPVA
ncbi:MAG: hypothetical protein ABI459_11940, partial [Deltaproteobacteria bacterium]